MPIASIPRRSATQVPDRGREGAAPPRILVVDDDADDRELVAAFLRRDGLTVVTAAGGREAVRVATSQPFDAVVLDVVMPGRDGWQVGQELASVFVDRPVPLVMMSSLPVAAAMPRSFEGGASAHVAKPINASVLVSTLRELV